MEIKKDLQVLEIKYVDGNVDTFENVSDLTVTDSEKLLVFYQHHKNVKCAIAINLDKVIGYSIYDSYTDYQKKF